MYISRLKYCPLIVLNHVSIRSTMKPEVPSKSEFLRGIQKYERDATYKVVRFYIEKHWNNPLEMTYSLVLFILGIHSFIDLVDYLMIRLNLALGIILK